MCHAACCRSQVGSYRGSGPPLSISQSCAPRDSKASHFGPRPHLAPTRLGRSTGSAQKARYITASPGHEHHFGKTKLPLPRYQNKCGAASPRKCTSPRSRASVAPEWFKLNRLPTLNRPLRNDNASFEAEQHDGF